MEKNEMIEVVAVARGFRGGRLIEPGAKFMVDAKKIPKWARLANDAASAAEKGKAAVLGDTRPAAAAKAAAEKGKALSGG